MTERWDNKNKDKIKLEKEEISSGSNAFFRQPFNFQASFIRSGYPHSQISWSGPVWYLQRAVDYPWLPGSFPFRFLKCLKARSSFLLWPEWFYPSPADPKYRIFTIPEYRSAVGHFNFYFFFFSHSNHCFLWKWLLSIKIFFLILGCLPTISFGSA